MKVKLDLRPAYYKEIAEKKVDWARIVASVLVLSFLLVSGFTFGYGLVVSRSLKRERISLQNRIERLQMQNVSLGRELDRLKAVEEDYRSALRILQQELLSLEFFAVLEKALPRTVWLETASMQKGRVGMSGNAFTENDVVDFGRSLMEAPVVRAVGFPVTSRVTREGESVIRFNLDVGIKDIMELHAESPEREAMAR
ncbi:MAG: Fimbrial assembly family protein [Synergistales bacterium 54_9]|nr:MAG: Fimbrial assembly family protein [Synergistales bacterium 54_9]